MVSLTLLPKTLVLVLIITLSITVTNLQLADGFKADGNKKIFQLNPGETEMIPWAVTNNKNVTLNIVLYASGEGSELFVFEENHTIEPGIRKEIPIYVSIPDDHPTDIEYRPELYVQRPAPILEEGVTGISVALQYRNLPIIKIGDNPIYTPPVVIDTERKIIHEDETVKTPKAVEEIPEETIEEKLQRIREANQVNAPAEVKVDDIWEESFEEEAVVDYEPDPEYTMEPEPVAVQTTEKVECGFIDWILSLFGMAKC